MQRASHANIPDSMRAAAPCRPGGPEVLLVERRPVPQPGPGQVLIEVAYAGVNRHDCNQRQRGAPPPGATDILGLEASGRIVGLGDGVPEIRLGESVCALTNGGSYADFVIAESGLALPAPPALDEKGAAALPEALFTAWLNLVELCDLKKGETLLVHGGSSGVGVIAIQLGRLLGATVLATAGEADKGALTLAQGAAHAFNYRTDDFVDGVMKATGGRGADVILDMAGGLYAERNLRALAPDGRVTHLSSGQQPVYAAPLALIMQKRARVTGALLRPLELERKLQIAARLKEIVWPVIGAGLTAVIDSVFPLEEASKAHAHMEAGLNKGKILLAPRSSGSAEDKA